MLDRKLLLSMLVASAMFVWADPARAEWKADDIPAAMADGSGKRFQKGRVLVLPRAGLSAADLDDALKSVKGKRLRRMSRINAHVIEVPVGDEERAVQQLRKDRRFKSADLNLAFKVGAVPNDVRYPGLWHLQRINAPAAWDIATGEGVTIAILDTGVDGAHEDLRDRMVPGWNIYGNNSDTRDIQRHGTQVAGLAGASGNNTIGTTGVTWNANIMPLRIAFLDAEGEAWAYGEHAAAAIEWAADHGAHVANLSYEGMAGSSIIQTASNYMRGKGGVVLVCSDNTSNDPHYPVFDAFVTVGALTRENARAFYSSYGAHLDISAPGHIVTTTAPGNLYSDNFNGCSAATPVAAGVYALMLSANPRLTPAQMDAIVFATADDLGVPGRDDQFGHGRIDAAEAVARALVEPPPPDQEPPVAHIVSPAAGAQWSGTLNVDATANDNTAVTYVDLYLNGTKIITDISPPYAFSVNTRLYANGPARLEVRAGDAAGNVGVSQPVVGTFFNDLVAPTVQITEPLNGATVSGTIVIRANATDNVGVASVQFFRGDKLMATQLAAPYRFSWNTGQGFDGPTQLRVRALDAAGNSAQAMLSVTVANSDTQAPTTSITSPAGGTTVRGIQLVEAKAGDNRGVERVELYFQGALVGTTKVAPYRFNWDTTKHPNGRGHLTTKAYDYHNNSKVSTKRAVIVAN